MADYGEKERKRTPLEKAKRAIGVLQREGEPPDPEVIQYLKTAVRTASPEERKKIYSYID